MQTFSASSMTTLFSTAYLKPLKASSNYFSKALSCVQPLFVRCAVLWSSN